MIVTPKMSVPWAIYYGLWFVLFLASELFSGSLLPRYWWPMVYGLFFIAEIPGAMIKQEKGDTLSETFWAFSGGTRGRRVFTSWIGIVLMLRAGISLKAAIYNLTVPMAVEYIPLSILILGGIVWLRGHFYYQGDEWKKGNGKRRSTDSKETQPF